METMTRRHAALTLASALSAYAAKRDVIAAPVRLHRLPDSAIQPQAAVDPAGALHLVYYTGDARHGDLFYTRSTDGGATFSRALAVNRACSAIAAGTIRGAQLALGKAGRVHVAWNGTMDDGPLNPVSGRPGAPMLYTRLNDAGDRFEPERNLMLHSFFLDGGGSVAADANGNVYVVWHGVGQSELKAAVTEGEARRRVWVTKSNDGGKSFADEAKAWAQDTGTCGCCGMKIFVNHKGEVFALYRSATKSVHRDIYLLHSTDRGRTFQGRLLHKWDINACPMSSMDFAENTGVLACAWETGGQIYWTRITGASGAAGDPIAAPGEGKGRKHPRLAVNARGEILLVWTEGTGWQKGGSLAYQLYDPNARPATDLKQIAGIPAWSFAVPIARPDNGFSVLF
jgi:hypothetical protein